MKTSFCSLRSAGCGISAGIFHQQIWRRAEITTLFCSCLCLVSAAFAAPASSEASAEEALERARCHFEGGLANHGEVLAAERELLACRVQRTERPDAELEQQVSALCRRAEDYYQRCLGTGLADVIAAHEERLRFLALLLDVERRAGTPLAATRARMLSLHEALVAEYERRYHGGVANHAELEAARRARAAFLAEEK